MSDTAEKLLALLTARLAPAQEWWTIVEVAAYLRMSKRTAQRLVDESRQAQIAVPCRKIGRLVTFRFDQIDNWVQEVQAWRVSKHGTASTRSDGASSTDSLSGAPARTYARRASSSSKSRPPSASDATGSLRLRAANPPSK